MCEIIKDNLIESEAFYWEEKIIETLVFEYGYSIDIVGNRSSEKGSHLINGTWGGEGISGWKHTEELKEKLRNINIGKCNPMYGKKGKDSPNYGRHHTNTSKKKISESHKGLKHSEETKRKMKEAHKGKFREKNGNSKYIICLNDLRIFPSLLDASEFYNISHYAISKVLRGTNDNCGKKIGKKLKFKYLIWKHNKKYKIKKEND